MLKQLHYLAALAQEKHFGRAAQRCNVTQPTLSAGIKQIEGELGVLIVKRGQRFEGFTAEGLRVLEWAQRILADRDSLAQEIGAMRRGLSGRLRVGAIPATLPIIALLTTAFSRQHPGVSITVLSQTSREIERGLAAFDLDVGLTYLENEPLRHVRTVPLYVERYLLLTPATKAFADRKTVTWNEAADLPLCLLTPDMQNRRIINSIFRRGGRTPKTVVETNSIVGLCSHVRFGHWSSVLPHTFLHLFPQLDGLLQIPLAAPEATQKIGLVLTDRDPPSPIARAMSAIARKVDIPGSLRRLAKV
jgi:DNA-binding transcriptional LysR family regulator